MDDEGEVGHADEQVAAHVGEWLTFRVLLNTATIVLLPLEERGDWGSKYPGAIGPSSRPACVHCQGLTSYRLGKWPLHPTCLRWLRDVYYPSNGEVGLGESQQWVLNNNKRNGRW